jgi:hypothetical protein
VVEEAIPLPARQTILATLADRAEADHEAGLAEPEQQTRVSEGVIKPHGLEPTPLAVVVAQGSRVKIAREAFTP